MKGKEKRKRIVYRENPPPWLASRDEFKNVLRHIHNG
jgi:hypothetical protein